jgi:hypothetical protein
MDPKTRIPQNEKGGEGKGWREKCLKQEDYDQKNKLVNE